MPLYTLSPWQPGEGDFAAAEVRITDNGTVVLSLAAEGVAPSQCWAWLVHPASRLPYRQGVNLGSDLDKEMARRQADAAAEAYGYHLDNRISGAPAVARRIVNMSVGAAAVFAQGAGIVFRIGSENGRGRQLHDDRNRDRVTVTVMDGIVVAATVG
jgi:hypothetical protein